MSEALSKGEIETVLAAVRRLVSLEERTDGQPGSSASMPPLLLTPAQLVPGSGRRGGPDRVRVDSHSGMPGPAVEQRAGLAAGGQAMSGGGDSGGSAGPAPQAAHRSAPAGDPAAPAIRSAARGALAADLALTAEVPPAAELSLAPAPLQARPAARAAKPIARAIQIADDLAFAEEPAAAPVPDQTPAPAAAAAPSAAIAPVEDEAAMLASVQELMGQLVRSELQGALGRQISGRIRQLVRAEVARALALREAEIAAMRALPSGGTGEGG